jgi:hypothetical protein
VRISKELSGGRGEYEWCDFRPDDSPAGQLRGRRIFLQLPAGITADTGCILDVQGGKQLIRIAPDMADGRDLYPPWHVAALLMMPRPSRDETSWGAGSPIMRNREYGIVHLHIRRHQGKNRWPGDLGSFARRMQQPVGELPNHFPRPAGKHPINLGTAG